MIHRSADPSNLAVFRANLASNKTRIRKALQREAIGFA